MKKNNKNEIGLTDEQVDKLKLLETVGSFQDAVADFRKKFSINISNGSFNLSSKINPGELHRQVYEDLRILGEKLGLPYSLMRSQVITYIKYNKWGFDPAFPKKFMEPCLETPVNYNVINIPMAQMNEKGEVIKYSEAVCLLTHARLSTKEEKEAIKDLRLEQKLYLDPKLTKQVRRKKNIERDIKTEEGMAKRTGRRTEEVLTGYVAIAQKQHDKGLISDKELKKAKLNNSHEIERVKVVNTSREVAKKVLGSKKQSDNARQIAHRISKKRREMFGDNM